MATATLDNYDMICSLSTPWETTAPAMMAGLMEDKLQAWELSPPLTCDTACGDIGRLLAVCPTL